MIYIRSTSNKMWTISGQHIPPRVRNERQRMNGIPPYLMMTEETYSSFRQNPIFRSLLASQQVEMTDTEPAELAHTMERIENDNRSLKAEMQQKDAELQSLRRENEDLLAQVNRLREANVKLSGQLVDARAQIPTPTKDKDKDKDKDKE